MLKTLTAISALALVLAGQASAEARFEGTIKFTKKNKYCDGSVKVGDEARSHYRPGNILSDNPNEWSGINMVRDFEATGWGTNSDLTLSFQKSYSGTLREKFIGRTSEDGVVGSLVSIRLVELPPAMDSGTQTVTIRGQIKNPFGKSTQKRCIADFIGTYFNRSYAPN